MFLLCALAVITAGAIPADPTPVRVAQPDGDSITLRLVGDEYYHYNTTADGYTVVNHRGRWEYARLSGNRLESTGVAAHDASRRSAEELKLLSTTPKYLVDRPKTKAALKSRAARDNAGAPHREPVVDYGKFRGLIVLINFNDRAFLVNEPYDFYNDMVNTKNYTGFTNAGRFNSCPGSVRDYFYDQSMGQFDPVFDVVGPVNVPFSVRECGENYSEVFKTALDMVDDQVDFTLYDSDSDGGIDMVFFLVAGYSASYSGNSDEYLWPHMSYLYGQDETGDYYYLQYDGMYMGRYASSTEIYGWESYGMTGPNGIGTICHEFGHVLGLPDLYDTDYAENGQSNHPGDWDVMAGGSSADRGRRPVGYSLWERTELGWATPTLIEAEGNYTLIDLSRSNEGYRINTPEPREYFLLENRQPTKWDAALPSHGMVIARVDNTNPRIWDWNAVNNYPEHNYYELLRNAENSPAFPGSGEAAVTEIGNFTFPGLLTWAGLPNDYELSEIAEHMMQDATVTFTVKKAATLNALVEDFETMPVTTVKKVEGVQGRFVPWNFNQCFVTAPDSTGLCNGAQACSMVSPSVMTMAGDVDADVVMVSANVNNPTNNDAKVKLSVSTNGGSSWQEVGTQVVEGNSATELSWLNRQSGAVRYRINIIAGSKTQAIYLDDFTISYTGEIRTQETLNGDVDGSGIVDVDDVNAMINLILLYDQYKDKYPGNADLDGNGLVDVDDVNALINIILSK